MSLPLSIRALGVLTLKRQPLYNIPAFAMGVVRAYSEDVKSQNHTTTSAKQTVATIPRGRLGLTDHRVNRLEKYLLVWGGKYKTVKEVPDLVNQDIMERARNKARIKINLMMMLGTFIGCLVMIYIGRKARDSGESLVKVNQDWHQKVREEAAIPKEKLESAEKTN